MGSAREVCMGYPTCVGAGGIRGWLLAVSMSALFACTPVHRPSKPVACLAVFSCSQVAVPPFLWEAPEDRVYLEAEKAKGRDVPSPLPSVGGELARRMAVCLKAKGVRASAVAVDPSDRLSDQVAALHGQGFSCALLGRVERYEERIGSDWSVNRPASVAFTLRLLETGSGRVLWKGAFDEAQQPLSENLLTLKRFVSRRARWVPALELAESGFRELAASMARAGGSPCGAAQVP